MAARDQTTPARQPPARRDEAEPVEQPDEQDETVADSFPASDPPSNTGIVGPRRKPGSNRADR